MLRQILTKKIFEKPASVGKLERQDFLQMKFHIFTSFLLK